MTAQALPFILLLGFLFGTSMMASRFSVGQYAPSTYLGLRLTLAGVCYAAAYALSRRRRLPTDRYLWKHAAILGVFGTAIPMTAFVTGMLYLSSGIAALLMTASPALTVTLAHFVLPDETLTRQKGLGVSLALGGAVLLVLSGESGLPDASTASPLGYALILGSMACFSAFSIYVRRYMRALDTYDVASVRMWVAAVFTLPLSILLVGFDVSNVDGQGYMALLYAAVVGTFVAFALSFYNVQRFGAMTAALSSYVTPVVATIGGILLLGETFSTVMVAGMGLIIGGIALINRGAGQQSS